MYYDHNLSRKLCFHHPGHVPVICGNPGLHFEGAGNGPVVITWIGREHELYSGVSPISRVEHCVTFRHDRMLLSLLGFVHNWPTSRWSVTNKENRFSLNRKGIMSSLLWRQFYRSTLYLLQLLCSWLPHLLPTVCFVKSFRAPVVFERSTKRGWLNSVGSSSDGLVIWVARLSSDS